MDRFLLLLASVPFLNAIICSLVNAFLILSDYSVFGPCYYPRLQITGIS